jgi:multidrug efflux system membrane fusion protein
VRSRLDSQVIEVKFHDGDSVQAGDLLFVLDDRTLQAQAGELEANVRRDKAQLENLRQQYERDRALTAKGFETQANLDTAKAAYEAQRGTVGASEAALQSVQVQLGYTRIMAPIAGRTGTINVTVGNTVKANDTNPLVTINQVQPIRVQTSLSQNYFEAVRAAMAAGSVEVAAVRQGGGEPSAGTLEYIDNTIDQSTGTFAARARFANADEKLWPGMFVTLTLNLGLEKGALVVPEVAVQHGQNGDYLFVIEGGKVAMRNVKVARMQDQQAIIAEGVKDGEQIAVDGILALKDGTAVAVKETKAEPGAPGAQP